MFTRRPRRPAAHDVLVTTTYGCRQITVRGSRSDAVLVARRLRADTTTRRVRIVPSASLT